MSSGQKTPEGTADSESRGGPGLLFSPSAIVAGMIAVMVGYSSSVAIIFQAAEAAGASEAQIGSWLWALGIGMGVTSFGLSLWFRMPVLTAWSTPGAALLVGSVAGLTLGEITGAFVFCSVLLVFGAVTGWFERLMKLIPSELAAAMLAGVLLQFGIRAFTAIETDPVMAGLMLLSFLILRPLLPRMAIPTTLLVGLVLLWFGGEFHYDFGAATLAGPVFVMPEFSLPALIGVGVPLFIVTMAGQNLSGLAVFRANAYRLSSSPLIGWTGAAGVLLAPFGGFAFGLAAITATICMSDETGLPRQRRYISSVWAGVFYILTGIFAGWVVHLFAALPVAFVASIAGLALLGTIAGSLAQSLGETANRDAAFLTFIVTASGLSFLDIGSAFWGIVLGLAVSAFHRTLKKHLAK
ncbi:benzoate/H(+) symporter BenE family transporter [Kiloniella sp. b19]|uniref:benzoate/H(+) symporter BenE family transporter n=1 Tax=Kiloniella sp. GXU_MW_B19 TaxID=3141326 RepID=UPI0031D90877